jgi:hypothetical protein
MNELTRVLNVLDLARQGVVQVKVVKKLLRDAAVVHAKSSDLRKSAESMLDEALFQEAAAVVERVAKLEAVLELQLRILQMVDWGGQDDEVEALVEGELTRLGGNTDLFKDALRATHSATGSWDPEDVEEAKRTTNNLHCW